MLGSLMLAAFLMGLGGMPHCAAMCGAACSVVFPGGVPVWSLVGRCVGYALLGGVAAASAGVASAWGRQFSFLQPFWVMAQAAAFALGLWLLVTGRMPAAIEQSGITIFQRARAAWRDRVGRGGVLRSATLWSFMGGFGWALLPCGLLYAAVMTAALAATPAQGALVMLCFAVPGAVGVWLAPALLARVRRSVPAQTGTPVPIIWMRPASDQAIAAGEGACAGGSKAASPATALPATAAVAVDDVRWAIRLSGAMLAAMSAWGAYHLVLAQWQAWCA